MPNNIQNIHRAFANAAAHKKIDGPAAAKIIDEARRNGLTQSEADTLVHEVAARQDSFTPEAKATFDDFIKNKMKSEEILDRVPPDKGPLKDPAVVPADSKRLGWETVPDGKLFIKGPSGSDVEQNYLGDCYLMAAASAVAHSAPKDIEKMFTRKSDGTYDVRLYSNDGGKLVAHTINIDAELPRNGWYGYYYAGDKNPKELWPALLEKAFAVRAGNYNAIQGGEPGNAMASITGLPSKSLDLRAAGTTPEATFAAIEAAVKAGKPATAVTLSDESAAKYKGTNIFTDHTYTIWGTSVEGGVSYVHLRNPWGDTEPKGNGRDDGIFKIPLKEFMSLFCGVAING